MAPFMFDIDDDRHDYSNLVTVGSTNPEHAGAEASDLSSAEGGPPTEKLDHAEDISVALEWKLLFPLLAPGASDPRPDDQRPNVEACHKSDAQACLEQVHDCVARTVRETGEHSVAMHALLKEGIEEKDLWGSSWVVKKANSAEPLEQERSLEGYIWVPVEICSPKMQFKDPGTYARMRKVLGALSSKHRLVANCSCEVHIHLGRMDGRAWSLPTLKRLGSLLWVAEPTLRSIRDPRSPNFDNVYTWGFAMRQRSRLAKRLEDGAAEPSQSVTIPDRQISDVVRVLSTLHGKDFDALIGIWRAVSHIELGQLLSGPEKMYRRLGFNFSAFGEEDERAKRNPRTMEFRMMDGSVEVDLILGWLVICGTVVEAAVVQSDKRFGAALSLLLHRMEAAERTVHPGAQGGCGPEIETEGNRLGREFHELMQALAIEERHYRGLEDKIRREHI